MWGDRETGWATSAEGEAAATAHMPALRLDTEGLPPKPNPRCGTTAVCAFLAAVATDWSSQQSHAFYPCPSCCHVCVCVCCVTVCCCVCYCLHCRYEVFDLRVIHRRRRTGFEDSKELQLRRNDLIAGRYQVREIGFRVQIHTLHSYVHTYKHARVHACVPLLTACVLFSAHTAICTVHPQPLNLPLHSLCPLCPYYITPIPCA